MSDDQFNRGKAGRQRIDINDEYEIRNWCESLSVTEDQLRDAVRNVGPEVTDVKDFLGKTVARP